jgi:hypothetical protein
MGVGDAKRVNVEVATDNLDAYEMYLTAREYFVNRSKLGESARLARLEDWAGKSETGKTLADIPQIYLAFRAFDELEQSDTRGRQILWLPDAAEFRGTPQFKRLVRNLGIYDFWLERGFPSQCRPLGDDDFECDQELKP